MAGRTLHDFRPHHAALRVPAGYDVAWQVHYTPNGKEVTDLPELGLTITNTAPERLMGWHTFRHSYRSWLDETGAPLIIQKELMRHASIQTTMNIYGKAMTDSKRQAHGKVVEMVLNASKSSEKALVSAIGS